MAFNVNEALLFQAGRGLPGIAQQFGQGLQQGQQLAQSRAQFPLLQQLQRQQLARQQFGLEQDKLNAPLERQMLEQRIKQNQMGLSGRKVGAQKIFTDGTIIQSTMRGPVVFAPDGRQVQGQEARDVLASAQQSEIALTGGKAEAGARGRAGVELETGQEIERRRAQGQSVGELEGERFGGRAQLEREITAAKEAAKAEAAKTKESRSNAKALTVYNTARDNLINSFGGAVTGPAAGLLPAIGGDARKLEAAISIMRPVIKDVVRSAGEGTFTDQDQKLIDQMIPSRKDTRSVAEVKTKMLDEFIRAKLGAEAPTGKESQPSVDSGAPNNNFGGFKILGVE